MNVHDALSQIADIRQKVARAQRFRGYKPLTTAFTGAVALATAGLQAVLMPEPHARAVRGTSTEYARAELSFGRGAAIADGVFRIDYYLYLWFAAAMVSLLVVGGEMWWRVRQARSDLQRDLTMSAVEQFVPALVAGLLLTIVIAQFAPEAIWMLPGLWMILFAMGVYASRRVLPPLSSAIAGFYLMAGLVTLAMQKEAGLHAWTMGLVFGVGQMAAAGLLWVVERRYER